MAVVTRTRGGEAAQAEWVATCSAQAEAASAGTAAAAVPETPVAPYSPPGRAEPDAGVPHRRRWSDALDEAPSSGAEQFLGVRPRRQQWKSMVGLLSSQAVDSARVIREAVAYFGAPRALRKVLDDTVDGLVRTSLRAQQISRLASGRVWPQKEHVGLDRLVAGVLDQRRCEWRERGIDVQASLQPAEVLADPSGVGMMVEALLDWAALRAAAFELTVESSRWPAPASIRLRLAAPEGRSPRTRTRRMDDGLHLPLAMQVASWLDVKVLYREQGAAVDLQISFPQTYRNDMGLATVELLDAQDGQGPAGWALVLAADDELRSEAVHVLSRAGVRAQGAATCAEATKMFEEDAPSVLVFSSDVPEDDFAALSPHRLAATRRCALVEITPDKPTFPDSGFTAWQVPRVGLAALEQELPAAVLFEFARVEAGC